MKGNRTFLLIGLPLVVVIPLLIVTYLIGPTAIWLWAGIGLGMAIFSVAKKLANKEVTR